MNVKEFRTNASLSQKIIFAIYILSFLIATSTHIRDIVLDGFLPYNSKPLWANIFWTSLTLADLLAIILLLFSLRKGLFLYAVIIISDVIINLYFTISYTGFHGIFNIYMIGQLFFLLFLGFTLNFLDRDLRSSR